MKTVAAIVVGLVASLSQAHMEMKSPPPLRSGYNHFTRDQDWDMTSPLSSNGHDFPCKGSLRLLGTPQGQAVADWVAGQAYSVTITGNAPHSGGSCQVSLSTDRGRSFKVVHSYIGNCPIRGDSSYRFTLPADTPAGEALVAWTWFNNVGNREMYMNCAVVNVKQGGAGNGRWNSGNRNSGASGASSASFSSRPAMFEANIGNGCYTTEGYDVLFPNPGEEVDMRSRHTHPPVGRCPK
ncbi:hypothetical protein CDD83_4020 [Cordyceps sp. RAO-2017]|nr:hypothetical protein CDD83_4020 [Cordyceps sp. RAO-2017]